MSRTKSTLSIDTTLALPEWLHQKYVVEGLGCPDIAKLTGRDSKTVWYWLRKHGIPTRPRGSDERQHFRKGHNSAMAGRHHSDETKAKISKTSRERGAVPYLKDGVHHLKGKRGAAVPNWKGGVTPERQTLYRSEEWKAAAALVWARDKATCQRCGLNHEQVEPQKRVRKFCIHHIVPFSVKELRTDPNNLVVLCAACHRWVHSKGNTERQFIKAAS